jgi:exosortase A
MTDASNKAVRTAIWICLAFAFVLWLYRDTAASMVAIWSSSETFAHGYVVPLISLWLVWRRREELAAMALTCAPSASALLGVVAAGVAWLVGEAATVNALRQFAVVAMLVLTVPAVAGWSLARRFAFPLGFLFFAVPFGDFLLPVLMQWTADVTVVALRLTGVPVYQEGMQLIIPSGTWSVVEACSGVRYLIASIMVGAIFAYLHYHRARRRWLFMLVAVAVPILANWARAYGIVMLGHLSGNKLAVGVDHLIYGWVFFGIVIGLMFLIGMRWSEPEGQEHIALPSAPLTATAAGGFTQTALAVGLVLTLALPIAADRLADRAVETATPRLLVPASVVGLPPADAAMPEWAPVFQNPAATLNRRVLFAGQPVGVYIGYYRNQGDRSKLVSSVNTLVSSEDKRWIRTASGLRTVDTGAGQVGVRTAQLRDRVLMSDSVGLTVWQVYWVDGTFETSDVRAKLRGAWQRLRGAGDDGAVIVLYTPVTPKAAADAALEALLRDHLAAIQSQLRATRDGD